MSTDDEGVEYCGACNGSGEGMHDGTRCWACRGTGEVNDLEDIEDDFDEDLAREYRYGDDL